MKMKKNSLLKLIDTICAIEGYIEYLEAKENKLIPSYDRKKDRINLKEAKLELERLYSFLNA